MEETAIYTCTFKPNTTTHWPNTKIETFSQALKIKKLNTLLNIPAGYEKIEINYDEISSITTSNKLHKGKIILGLFMIILGLTVVLSNWFIAIIGFSFGLLQLANCYTSDILIRRNNGNRTHIEIAYFEKKRAGNFISLLNKAMNEKQQRPESLN